MGVGDCTLLLCLTVCQPTQSPLWITLNHSNSLQLLHSWVNWTDVYDRMITPSTMMQPCLQHTTARSQRSLRTTQGCAVTRKRGTHTHGMTPQAAPRATATHKGSHVPHELPAVLTVHATRRPPTPEVPTTQGGAHTPGCATSSAPVCPPTRSRQWRRLQHTSTSNARTGQRLPNTNDSGAASHAAVVVVAAEVLLAVVQQAVPTQVVVVQHRGTAMPHTAAAAAAATA